MLDPLAPCLYEQCFPGAVSGEAEVTCPQCGRLHTDLVDALRNHTAAITNLVATLAPEVPDYVGTDYLARKLGVSPQWIGQMAERGDIPRQCIIKKTGKARIWKFNRIEIDQWLSEKGHG